MLSCSVWFSAPSFWMGGGLESRCVGRVCGADGAVPHRTHDPPSGSQDHHPSKNSVQKIICCNSTSNAPDDGRMYPKHVELRILPCCIKLAFHIISCVRNNFYNTMILATRWTHFLYGLFFMVCVTTLSQLPSEVLERSSARAV